MLEHVPKDLHSLSVNNVPKNEMNSAQFVYFQKSSDGF